MSIFNVQEKLVIDNSVVDAEYHAHQSSSPSFDYNDELRIPVEGDRPTLPCMSFLQVEGRIVNAADNKPSTTVKFVNNGVSHLFNEIRLEINGIPIDSTQRVGITSTMKGYVSFSPNQVIKLQSAGWKPDTATKTLPFTTDGAFSVSIPISTLLGFAEDYKKIIINIRQELVLIRSGSDNDALYHDKDVGKVIIDRILWRLPHIVGNLQNELLISKTIQRKEDIRVSFRGWDTYTMKDLPETSHFTWNIKSTKKSHSPLYVLLAFQVKREGKLNSDTSHFDNPNLRDARLYLNSVKYPYRNLNVDLPKYQTGALYDMYANFQQSYYGKESEPLHMLETFLSRAPMIVFDCSKQPESIAYQAQSVNVRLEVDTTANIKAETAAFCVLLYEKQFTYNPLTKYVKPL